MSFGCCIVNGHDGQTKNRKKKKKYVGGALLYNGVCGGMNACVRVSVVCECKRERGWVSFGGEWERGRNILQRSRDTGARVCREKKMERREVRTETAKGLKYR